MIQRCPLTNSNKIKLVRKIEAEKIAQLYDMFGIDIRDVFHNTKYVYQYHSIESDYSFYYPFTIQGEASLYKNLEKNDWYYAEQKWEHTTSLELIKPSDRVLEIGCGYGSFLLALKKKYHNDPTGIELNPDAVEKAVNTGLSVYREDLDAFSKKNQNAFDVVCFFQVLEHIADPVSFLGGALNTLKQNGRLIIAVPNNDSLLNKDIENALNYPPHHMGLWNEKSLKYLSRLLNIKLESIKKEPLQREHLDWYVRMKLKQFVGRQIYHRIISKTSIPRLFKKRVQAVAEQIDGHTILAVYQK